MRMQRTLAPTAAPVPFRNLLTAVCGFWGSSTHREQLVQELQEKFDASSVFLVSSGKSALLVILKALSATSTRRKVIIPAYTCFSVPSAIVKAGLEVVLCDIDPRTLDFKFEELERLLDEQVLCVLPTHLFGLPADVDRAKRLCKENGIFVVEDAAQAMGGKLGGRLLGTVGDVGFFSLGRGKNITSGSGGIIITRSPVLARQIQLEYVQLKDVPRLAGAFNWIQLILMGLFIHPALYWFPAGLPFLGLGETRFYTEFPTYRMDEISARQLQDWQDHLTRNNRDRAQCANRLMKQLEFHMHDMQPISHPEGVYLRLPVLVRDEAVRDSVCRLSRESGLGVGKSYPTTIQDIPELAGRITVRGCPGAQEVVNRLVTFPTHRFVQEADIQRMDRILGKEQFSGTALAQGRLVELQKANRAAPL
jgi:perosamine synthetase